MRTIPYDIQSNISLTRKVLGAITSRSNSFLPRDMSDLRVQCEENYTDGASNLTGNVVVHFDSDKSRFHVDVCSAMMPTKLYESKALIDNLMEMLNLRDFHRTMFVRRGFKNGRITLTHSR